MAGSQGVESIDVVHSYIVAENLAIATEKSLLSIVNYYVMEFDIGYSNYGYL